MIFERPPSTLGMTQISTSRCVSGRRLAQPSGLTGHLAFKSSLSEDRAALRLADTRMYAQKAASATPAGQAAATHIRIAAQLHDIGKMAIPESILHKPGPLDEHEWAFIRQRIIAACDAYDAMTSKRCYQASVESAAALQELRQCAGSHFDADVVEALCTVIAEEHPAPTPIPETA
jgi:response regulator RpfG family c-di-GMP phosphodiesterase